MLDIPSFLPKIPDGYYYAGVHKFQLLLSSHKAKIAYIDEFGNCLWESPNRVENKSNTPLVHTVFPI